MIKINDILKFLDKKFPISSALDYDNVGLLVGNGKGTAAKALICLDCDKNAVKTAIDGGYNLIITHHPVIFSGVKSITEENILYRLLKSDISVISMHTNLDIAKNGVNEALAETIGLKDIKTFTASDGFLLKCGETDFSSSKEFALHLKETLNTSVRFTDIKKPIKRVLVCSGSGGDFLQDAKNNSFDALVTADIKHNVFIDAVNCDFALFDAGHYQTENIVLPSLKKTLEKEFKDTEFTIYNSEFINFV